MKTSARLAALPPYAFAELDRLLGERLAAGADVIDFGVGDPLELPPAGVVAAAVTALREGRCAGYPSYIGSLEYRRAVARWLEGRTGVRLDPQSAVSASVGSKEAIFHLAEAFVDPGDVVLLPSPGYPPYARGAQFAEGRPVAYAVPPGGPTLPDLDALPHDVGDRLRVVWITQPHVPTGRAADLSALSRLAAQVRERDVLLCSDEAYSELWFTAPPASALQTGTANVLVFQSLSKRACMTGWRIGFVAGDERAVAAFRRLKTNIDSGTPDFVQEAAIAALADEGGPEEARRRYAERAAALLPALSALGCEARLPEAGFYLWVGTPGGVSGVEFARRLLEERPALAVMPGEWLAETLADGSHPGAGRVRLALIPDVDRCREAAGRLADWS